MEAIQDSAGLSPEDIEKALVSMTTTEGDNSAERSPLVPGISMATTPEATKRASFKQLLRKIGSGEHTSKGLTRAEADEAMELMLTGGASDVQIGAFLIAHRIRRPEPQELTGMLDTYKRLGPRLVS